MTVQPMRTMAPLAMLLMLGGCAGSMGTTRPGPSVPASAASNIEVVMPPVTAFDGTYRSRGLRVTGSFGSGRDTSSWCDSPGQPIITVSGGQFTYTVPHPNIPTTTQPTYLATMAGDGSFSGQIVSGSISGQVTGTHMEGKIDGSACLYAFSADRT